MAFDSLSALRAAGNPVDSLSPAQQEVLSNLTPAEVATLNSVKSRIDDIDEVTAHSAISGGDTGIGIY